MVKKAPLSSVRDRDALRGMQSELETSAEISSDYLQFTYARQIA
jgi:hypothetical protein